jgi:hypothetical protein
MEAATNYVDTIALPEIRALSPFNADSLHPALREKLGYAT